MSCLYILIIFMHYQLKVSLYVCACLHVCTCACVLCVWVRVLCVCVCMCHMVCVCLWHWFVGVLYTYDISYALASPYTKNPIMGDVYIGLIMACTLFSFELWNSLWKCKSWKAQVDIHSLFYSVSTPYLSVFLVQLLRRVGLMPCSTRTLIWLHMWYNELCLESIPFYVQWLELHL